MYVYDPSYPKKLVKVIEFLILIIIVLSKIYLKMTCDQTK